MVITVGWRAVTAALTAPHFPGT